MYSGYSTDEKTFGNVSLTFTARAALYGVLWLQYRLAHTFWLQYRRKIVRTRQPQFHCARRFLQCTPASVPLQKLSGTSASVSLRAPRYTVYSDFSTELITPFLKPKLVRDLLSSVVTPQPSVQGTYFRARQPVFDWTRCTSRLTQVPITEFDGTFSQTETGQELVV